jgi:hypothetical protein
MIPHFYVFGSGMKHWVFCYDYGTGAITKKWDLGALLTKVSQGVCDPQQLGTTTRGCNIFRFGGRLSYTRLLARRPRTNEDLKNWQEPEVDFLSIWQPAKSASEKP